jgi:hypothetical protein
MLKHRVSLACIACDLCSADSSATDSFIVAYQHSSRASNHSAPDALVAAFGGLERIRSLALPADSGRTSLGTGPVVERAAVLSLNSLVLDW